MSGDTEHTDVGAYALGLLEETDRDAFEAHLAGCETCTAELAGFSGMRELLLHVAHLKAEQGKDPPDQASTSNVVDLLRRREITQHRRRRGTTILSAAAGIALLGGGIALGASIADRDAAVPAVPPVRPPDHHGSSAQDLLARGERRSAVDPRTRVAGTVAMESKGWGTHVALDLGNVRGPRTCELVAVTRSGQRHVVAGWAVPPRGYGVPDFPTHLTIHGGTASPRSDIARFEVRAEGGQELLTIPV